MKPVLITFAGVTRTLREWARGTQMSRQLLAYRLARGDSMFDALTTPIIRKSMIHHCSFCGARGHHAQTCKDAA